MILCFLLKIPRNIENFNKIWKKRKNNKKKRNVIKKFFMLIILVSKPLESI